MRSHTKAALLIAVMATVLLALEPSLAVAAGTSRIGANLGDEVRSWGKALLLGVATLVGLPALARRDLGQSLTIGAIVIVIGGFIFADSSVKAVIETLWSTIGG
ncbi:MAG TPA: hypothetical protein VFG31_08060 [Conexibacter sp.]|nr:hypothetical protein [Conexibacter sp.]